MKKLIAAAAAVAATASPLALAAPAQADTPGYVTKAEFQKSDKGMKLKRVHAIYDTAGKWMYQGDGWLTREYKGWKKDVVVSNTYQYRNGAWRLEYKYAYTVCTDCADGDGY